MTYLVQLKRSKALAKRKGKGGRPRLPGDRETNGRLSRQPRHIQERTDMSEAEAMSVMVEARMKHTGLPAILVAHNEVGRPHAGNVHGVMCLRKEIDRDQWHAAEWFIGKRAAYLRSIKAQDELLATGLASSNGADETAYEQWVKATAETWEKIRECLQEATTEQRSPLASALDVMLIRGHYLPHMAGDLRIVLNAIHRRFLEGKKKA